MADDRFWIDTGVDIWADETLDLWTGSLPTTRSLTTSIAIVSATSDVLSPFAIGADGRLWTYDDSGMWADDELDLWVGSWPVSREFSATIALASITQNALGTLGDVRSLTASIAIASTTPNADRAAFSRLLSTAIDIASTTTDAPAAEIEVVLSQQHRAQLGWLNSRILVDIEIGDYTLRMSDSDYTYVYPAETLHYGGYLLQVQGLGEFSSTGGEAMNSHVILTVADEPFGGYTYLVMWNSDTPFAGCIASFYELLLDTDSETFDFDSRTLLHKMAVERVQNIKPGISFEMVLSSRLFAKRNSYGGQVITKAMYQFADPNHVGMPRNIIYGDIKNVPCRLILAGAIDLLSTNLGAYSHETTIYLSGVRQLEFTGPPFTIKIDDELMYCPYAPSGDVISGVTRGYSSTTITSHNKGVPVLDYLSTVLYEVAKHPVQEISAIRVMDVLETQYPDSGSTVRAYTGKSGDEHPYAPGCAILDFDLPAFIQKKIDQEVSSEHTHDDTETTSTSTDTGSHSHTDSSLSMITKHGISCTYTGVTNPANAYDYADTTYAIINASSLNSLIIDLESGTYGTLDHIFIHAKIGHSAGGTGNVLQISASGSTVYNSNQAIAPVWLGWTVTTTTWPTVVRFDIALGTGTNYDYDIYEAYVDCYYTAPTDASPATGVSTSVTTNVLTSVVAETILGGLTVADVLIGEEITVDCKGYEDTDGSITGVVNALIERPDYVIRHMLTALMGFSGDDLGSHMVADAGAWFYHRSWEFAFILHDIGDNMDVVLQSLAMQSGCALTDWAGKIDLRPINVAPAPVHRWDFLDSSDGWLSSGMSFFTIDSIAYLTSTGSDPVIYQTGLTIPGAYYNQVVVRFRRITGSTWQGTCFWSTSSHTFTSSYYKSISEPSGSTSWVEAVWDMTNPTAGTGDWIGSTVTGIRLDLGNSSGDSFQIDWIEVRSSESALPHTRLNWDFSGSTCGWWASDMAFVMGSTTLSAYCTGADGYLYYSRTPLGFYGWMFSRVVMRFKRLTGSGWEGICFYTTASHGYSGYYYKWITEPAGSSDFVEATWDMALLTHGGNDWYLNWITGVRFDLGTSAADAFEIDWIRIEPPAPPVTIDSDMLVEPPSFTWSGISDTKSVVNAFYARDYRGTTGRSQVIMPDVPRDALARGYFDCLTSAWCPQDGIGKLTNDLELKAVRNETQASEVMGIWGRKLGYPKLTVQMRLKWLAIDCEPGGTIYYSCAVMGDKYYRVTAFNPDPVSRIIYITAETWL